jgi:hypothetical protein
MKLSLENNNWTLVRVAGFGANVEGERGFFSLKSTASTLLVVMGDNSPL